MKNINIGCLALMLCLPLSTYAQSTGITDAGQYQAEHVVWNKLPIAFAVPVGHERLLSFPEKVKVINDDASLTSDKVTILNNSGTLYIKAKQVFDPVRLRVVIVSSGETILVDLTGVQNGDDLPLEVVLANSTNNSSSNQNAIDNDNADKSVKNSAAANVVSLTRFAIQQLYSPKRLLEENPNIYRTPMYTQKSVVLTTGDSLSAFPLISWRGGDLYVTAVLLRNNLHQSVSINPNAFLGCWQSISSYPLTSLEPAGVEGDRSTVFLVSSSPFGDALKQNCQVSRYAATDHAAMEGGSL